MLPMDALFEADESSVQSFSLTDHPEFACVLEGICPGPAQPPCPPLDRSQGGQWAVCAHCGHAYRVLTSGAEGPVVYRRRLPR
jgi:hypothetical protein